MQMPLRVLPETINIHVTRACNFGCRFCYAEFAECGPGRIPPGKLRTLLEVISRASPPSTGHRRKVNFAGGEPLLYPELPEIIQFCKALGLVTSPAIGLAYPTSRVGMILRNGRRRNRVETSRFSLHTVCGFRRYTVK